MALDDFQDIWQQVLDHGFGSTKYLAFAKEKVNEGQIEIAKRLDLRVFEKDFSAVGAAGDNDATLPSDLLRLAYVFNNTEDEPLQPLPGGALEFQTEATQITQRGKPTHYVVIGAAIHWWPTPDAAYIFNVRYYKRPVRMSADADVPEVPEELRPAIVSYAVAMCYRREQDFAAYQVFMADFNRQLAEGAYMQIDHVGEDFPTVVPGMW